MLSELANPMKLRIYTDTPVSGGCENDQLAEQSIRLIDDFVQGQRVLVLSSLTVQELAAAPAEVRRRPASAPEAHIETRQLDTEATELTQAHIAAGVPTGTMRADAQHIAMAIVR